MRHGGEVQASLISKMLGQVIAHQAWHLQYLDKVILEGSQSFCGVIKFSRRRRQLVGRRMRNDSC